MSSYIKKAFDIIRKNVIIIQPLILFFIVFIFTTAALFQLIHKITYIVFLITNILLCTAFISGWFYMIKKTIEHNSKVENKEYKSDKEEIEASLALGREFFTGVGDFFTPVTFTVVCYVAVYILIIFLSYKSGTYFLPYADVNWVEFMAKANSTPAEMHNYVASLSYNQLLSMNLWILYMSAIVTVFTFLTMFLFPAVFDKKEEYFYVPFSAFNRNLVFLCRNFWGSLGIIMYLFFLQIVFSMLSLLFSVNIIMFIIGVILFSYFVTYTIVLIFLYYETRK